MRGINVSPSFIAASLYTPPNAGWSFEVIRLVPTPHEPMAAPCALSDSIRYSSRSLDAHMTASGNPASSSIFLAFFERYDKSPLSRRIPYILGIRSAFLNSVNTLIALGTPERSVS